MPTDAVKGRKTWRRAATAVAVKINAHTHPPRPQRGVDTHTQTRLDIHPYRGSLIDVKHWSQWFTVSHRGKLRIRRVAATKNLFVHFFRFYSLLLFAHKFYAGKVFQCKRELTFQKRIRFLEYPLNLSRNCCFYKAQEIIFCIPSSFTFHSAICCYISQSLK